MADHHLLAGGSLTAVQVVVAAEDQMRLEAGLAGQVGPVRLISPALERVL